MQGLFRRFRKVPWAYLYVLDAINDAQILAAVLFRSLLLDAGGCLEGGNVYLHRRWMDQQIDECVIDMSSQPNQQSTASCTEGSVNQP